MNNFGDNFSDLFEKYQAKAEGFPISKAGNPSNMLVFDFSYCSLSI